MNTWKYAVEADFKEGLWAKQNSARNGPFPANGSTEAAEEVVKPLCKRGDFSALLWKSPPLEEWPSATALHAGCRACSHFHKPKKKKTKKLPNQFSKKQVALPLAGFLTLSASCIGASLNSKNKHLMPVFPPETFSLCLWLAVGKGSCLCV